MLNGKLAVVLIEKKKMHLFLVVIVLFLNSLTVLGQSNEQQSTYGVELDTLKLYDSLRQREIPIAIYQPNLQTQKKQKLVIFSHGYGFNRGGDYLAYSYLNVFLATKGYFVVSIQHELASDSLLPLTGNAKLVRRPFWERGADNIAFVINSLKETNPSLDFKHISLIGHSNGGDMVALFPQKYPKIVEKIITLDHRRMPIPIDKNINVYSLRSNDQVADEGVLPTDEEAEKFGIILLYLKNTTHNQMDDSANEVQRLEIQNHILSFLKQ